MSVLIVRYEVKEETVQDVEAEIREMISAIEDESPEGVRYALGKLSDGVTFMGFLELEHGADNPLPNIVAAKRFQEKLKGWVTGAPPAPEKLDVIGSYKLFE
jgi:hypothetical protein